MTQPSLSPVGYQGKVLVGVANSQNEWRRLLDINFNHSTSISLAVFPQIESRFFSNKAPRLEGVWYNFAQRFRDSVIRVYNDNKLQKYPPPRNNPDIKSQFVDNRRKIRISPDYFMLPDYLKSPRRQSQITRFTNDPSFIESCEITLATHLPIINLPNLESLAVSWPGPISAAVYLEDPEQLDNIEKLLWDYHSKFEEIRRARVSIHLLLGHRFNSYTGGVYHPYDLLYPVNYLRNLAVARAGSENFVMTMDSEFIPSSEMYTRLCGNLKGLHQETLVNPALFIVPEFEFASWNTRFDFYKDRESLTSNKGIQRSLNKRDFTRYCSEGWIIPDSARFSKQVLGKRKKPLVSSSDYDSWCKGKLKRPEWLEVSKNKQGVDYPRWFKSRKRYRVAMDSAILKVFEPLFIARKSQHPIFNENFKGGPFSKRPQIMDSLASGYSLIVLADVFAVKRTGASYLDDPRLSYEIVRDVLEATIGNSQAVSRLLNSRPQKFRRLLNSISWSEGFY